MARSWYRDGLQFTCTQCGHCCTGEPGYVWLTKKEMQALATHLQVSFDDFTRKYVRKVGIRYSLIEKPDGACVFYDKGCTVYAARPTQCRTFPFWPENLKSRIAWNELSEECPGVGQGRLYSVEEIGLIRRGKTDASQR